MSKPHIIDPDSVQLAPVSEYLGKGRGNGVLNDWNLLDSGLMHMFPNQEVPVLVVVLPMPCCSDEGGRAPYGHTAHLAAHGTRWSFLAAHPGHDTHVNTASTFPAMSFPFLISIGTWPDRVSRVETKIKPFPVLPPWKGNFGEFSNFLLCNFKDYSTPAWDHQGKVLKFPKGIFFNIYLFTCILVTAFPSAFFTELSPNLPIPTGFKFLRL